MMQTAVKVFAEKGYHAATVRDVVNEAGVAIGTFYFYFPDKETLFVYLYEETADFLVQTIQQAVNSRQKLHMQLMAGIQSYINIAIYEPAVVHLLLVGGVGALPSLTEKRNTFRENLISVWQRPLDQAVDEDVIPAQNTRRTAEAIAGGIDEVILQLLSQPQPESEANAAVQDLTLLFLRGVGYQDKNRSSSGT